MKVILTRDSKGLGRAGDIIEVSPGMAHNNLIPAGKAILATPENLKKHSVVTHGKEFHLQGAQKLAEAFMNALPQTIEVRVRTTPQGVLFESIDSRKLATELQRVAHMNVPREIMIDAPHIKSTGTYSITCKLKDGRFDKVITLHVQGL